jgi:hypothetical protein
LKQTESTVEKEAEVYPFKDPKPPMLAIISGF